MSRAYVAARSLPLIVSLKPGETAERGTELYILSVVMVVVARLFVAARINTRLLSTSGGQGLGQDDYCVMASLVFWSIYLISVSKELTDPSKISPVGLSITEIEATVHGYGNHMDDMTKAQNHEALMVSLTVHHYAIVIRD
jgi:hypothetical protein